MKKILMIVALGALMSACNGANKKAAETGEQTAATIECSAEECSCENCTGEECACAAQAAAQTAEGETAPAPTAEAAAE